MTGDNVDRCAVDADADVQRPAAHDALVVVGAIAGLHGAKRRLEGVDV
jgi:hypothetical protein